MKMLYLCNVRIREAGGAPIIAAQELGANDSEARSKRLESPQQTHRKPGANFKHHNTNGLILFEYFLYNLFGELNKKYYLCAGCDNEVEL